MRPRCTSPPRSRSPWSPPPAPAPAPAAASPAAPSPPPPRAPRPACPPCSRPAPTRAATSGSDTTAWAWGRGPQGQRARGGPGRGGAGVRAPWGRGRAAPAGARPSQDGGGHARAWGRVCAASGGGAARAGGAAAALARPSAPPRDRHLRFSRLARYGSARGPGRGGAQQRPGLPDQAVDPRERPGHGRAYLLEPGEGLGAPARGFWGRAAGRRERASEAAPRRSCRALPWAGQEGPLLLGLAPTMCGTTAEARLALGQRPVSLASVVPRWPP